MTTFAQLPPDTNRLSSDWHKLNNALLATLYPVDRLGNWLQGLSYVVAPATDVELDISSNWHSPFEGAGVESIMPKFSQALQTGIMGQYVDQLTPKPSGGEASGVMGWIADKIGINPKSALSRAAAPVRNAISEGSGRTGMTKLNSTQVYVGSAPIQISMALHFRAFGNPQAEVRDPIDELAQWTLPQQMATSNILTRASSAFKARASAVDVLLPSKVPQLVALMFGGYTFSPMVIEGMQRPLSGPRHGGTGEQLHAKVTLRLGTLTSLDKDDWQRAGMGLPIKIFGG